jgi:hypothetical protein
VLSKRFSNTTIIRIGLICTALAGISNVWLRRSLHLPENLGDLLVGFLYGIAIPTLCIGIWRKGRSSAQHGGSCG